MAYPGPSARKTLREDGWRDRKDVPECHAQAPASRRGRRLGNAAVRFAAHNGRTAVQQATRYRATIGELGTHEVDGVVTMRREADLCRFVKWATSLIAIRARQSNFPVPCSQE